VSSAGIRRPAASRVRNRFSAITVEAAFGAYWRFTPDLSPATLCRKTDIKFSLARIIRFSRIIGVRPMLVKDTRNGYYLASILEMRCVYCNMLWFDTPNMRGMFLLFFKQKAPGRFGASCGGKFCGKNSYFLQELYCSTT